MANQPQLLDLPPAWLGNMSLALGIRKRPLPLARTCKQLQQLVFRQSALRVKLCVLPDSIAGLGEHLVTRALAWAEAADIKLHLYLEGSCVQDDFVNRLLHSAALQHQELVGQCQDSPASLQLHSITAVSLEGPLEHEISFLPDSLVQTCPNLQDLSLDSLTIAASTDEPHHTCTSLQKLTFSSVEFANENPSVAFKQRLLDLPNLTALSLTEAGVMNDYDEDGVFHAAICHYRAQLRALCSGFDVCRDWLPGSPGVQLPVLRELNACTSIISDDQLQQLLDSAPNLEYVQLNSIQGLKTSFADVPCTWKELELHTMYAVELARLPLCRCTRLSCLSSLNFGKRGDISTDRSISEQIASGAAAAQAAGGLHFGASVVINIYSDDLERLSTAVPLLHNTFLDHVILEVICPVAGGYATWSQALPVLKLLGEHLKCKELFLGFNAINEPGVAAQLPHLFPHVQEFHFRSARVSDDGILAMVRTASRPFKLRLIYASRDLQQQLQQAVQEAGHHLVTLEFDYTLI